MIKNIKMIKTAFILGLIYFSLFAAFSEQTTAKNPLYNASVIIDLKWSDVLTDEPIVPRGEVVELELIVVLEIETGLTFGAGLIEGYKKKDAIIDLYIVDYPSWCSVALKYDLLLTNISEREEASTTLYLHVDEDAPAFTTGIIKILVDIGKLGFIFGNEKEFNLTFKPAYFPIIKTNLPDTNTKRINPLSKAVVPIEVENAGNADTKVFFEVLNVPDDWTTTITDFVILDETKGSKETAYLNVIPSSNFGYYDEEVNIMVKITPAYAEEINITGKPIFANFIIKNRGFSTSGMEFYIPIAIIILIIIFLILVMLKKKRKKTEE